MKKDIELEKVDGLKMMIVYEYNDVFKTNDWNVYLVNEKPVNLETILIVSRGFSATKNTSYIRRQLDSLPANSYAKIELIEPELFSVNNQFQISFFEGVKMKEATFVFPENTIAESALQEIPNFEKKGIFAKQIV